MLRGTVATMLKLGMFSDEFHFSFNEQKISLFGCYLGKIHNITSVGDVVTDLLDPTDIEAKLRQIITDWETSLRHGKSGLEPPQRVQGLDHHPFSGFKGALLRLWSPLKDRDSEFMAMAYDIWRENNPSGKALHFYIDGGRWDMARHELRLRNFEKAVFPRVHGCQMFTTEEGSTGAVAGNCRTQIGDELWGVFTGPTPLILRRVSDVEHCLISPSYLHGKMDYSAFSAMRNLASNSQEVVLV